MYIFEGTLFILLFSVQTAFVGIVIRFISVSLWYIGKYTKSMAINQSKSYKSVDGGIAPGKILPDESSRYNL